MNKEEIVQGALVFVSRHAPTEGQIRMAQQLGYSEVDQIEVYFGKDPAADLAAVGVTPDSHPEIAVVAPAATVIRLLLAGFSLVEFTNERDARNNGQFRCTGVTRFGTHSDTPYGPYDECWVHGVLSPPQFIPLQGDDADCVDLFAGARKGGA